MQACSKKSVATKVAKSETKVSKPDTTNNPEVSEVDQAKFSNVSMIVNMPSDIEAQAVEDSVASLMTKLDKTSKKSQQDQEDLIEKKSVAQEPVEQALAVNVTVDTIEDSGSAEVPSSKEKAIQQPAQVGSKDKAEANLSDESKPADQGCKRQISEITQDPDSKDDAEPVQSCKRMKLDEIVKSESKSMSKTVSDALTKEKAEDQQVSAETSSKKEVSPTKMQSGSTESDETVEEKATSEEKEVSSKLKDLNLQDRKDDAKSQASSKKSPKPKISNEKVLDSQPNELSIQAHAMTDCEQDPAKIQPTE